jgi:hypothetical protein
MVWPLLSDSIGSISAQVHIFIEAQANLGKAPSAAFQLENIENEN